MFEQSFLDPPPPYQVPSRPPRGSEVVTGADWAEHFPSPADQWVAQVGVEAPNDFTLAKLAEVDVEDLSLAGQAEALQILDRFACYLEARRAELRAAMAGPEPATTQERLDDFSALEVAVAERCSARTADGRIHVARDLAGRLRRSAAVMRAGRMTMEQARALSEAAVGLTDEQAQKLEGHMLRFCHRQDIGLFRKALRRWLPKVDPDWEEKARQARADAVVYHTPLGDGTGELYIKGPLEITEAMNRALSAHAAKTKPELGGTVDQRKLVALRDMIDRYLASPDAARRHGRLPEVQVAVELPVLLGLRKGVAEIPGVGALPVDVARCLLADGAPLRRLIIDPVDGKLLDYGRDTYLVPPPLADYLIALNVRSATPYSGVPANATDMEHNEPYDDRGTTDPLNNNPTERRWHRGKTHGKWTYRKNPKTKRVTWIAPSGLSCTIDPYDYRI